MHAGTAARHTVHRGHGAGGEAFACRDGPQRPVRMRPYNRTWRSTMKMRTATLDAAAAVNLLKHARSVCDQLNPLGTPMTMAELQQRAQIVDSVIRARTKL